MIVLALWMGLAFTAPSGDSMAAYPKQQVARYRLFQRDEYGNDAERTIFAAPNVNSGAPTPRAPGEPDTVWFTMVEDMRPRMYRVCSEDSAGNLSQHSNAVVVLAPALADTGYIDLTGTNDRFTGTLFVQSRPVLASPGMWYAAWRRAPGDSSFTILPHWRATLHTSSPVLSLRSFQYYDRNEACANGALIGWPYYAEGGEWRACP